MPAFYDLDLTDPFDWLTFQLRVRHQNEFIKLDSRAHAWIMTTRKLDQKAKDRLTAMRVETTDAIIRMNSEMGMQLAINEYVRMRN